MWAVAGRRAWCWPDPGSNSVLPTAHGGCLWTTKGSVSSLGKTAPLKGSHRRFERGLVLIFALIRKFRHSPFLSPRYLPLIANNFFYFSALKPFESFSIYANLYLLCFTIVYDEKLAFYIGTWYGFYAQKILLTHHWILKSFIFILATHIQAIPGKSNTFFSPASPRQLAQSLAYYSRKTHS